MILERRGVGGAYWALLVAAIIVSSVVTYYLAPGRQAETIETKGSSTTSTFVLTTTFSQSTSLPLNASLLGLNPVAIYGQASPSVVTVEGVQSSATGNTTILGSGFVTEFQGNYYVITNYHVVQGVVGPTVTFSDAYANPATVVGTDPYVDLAVLSVQAPQS